MLAKIPTSMSEEQGNQWIHSHRGFLVFAVEVLTMNTPMAFLVYPMGLGLVMCSYLLPDNWIFAVAFYVLVGMVLYILYMAVLHDKWNEYAEGRYAPVVSWLSTATKSHKTVARTTLVSLNSMSSGDASPSTPKNERPEKQTLVERVYQ